MIVDCVVIIVTHPSQRFKAWDQHYGLRAVGISWTLLNRDDLAEVTACIGMIGFISAMM